MSSAGSHRGTFCGFSMFLPAYSEDGEDELECTQGGDFYPVSAMHATGRKCKMIDLSGSSELRGNEEQRSPPSSRGRCLEQWATSGRQCMKWGEVGTHRDQTGETE